MLINYFLSSPFICTEYINNNNIAFINRTHYYPWSSENYIRHLSDLVDYTVIGYSARNWYFSRHIFLLNQYKYNKNKDKLHNIRT